MNLHFLPFFRDIGETDMAFDGIVISNVVRDMKEKLIDGRIYKIYQPEKDELNIVIKNNRENYRLLMSYILSAVRQGESYDSAEFLYAPQEAYQQRKDS